MLLLRRRSLTEKNLMGKHLENLRKMEMLLTDRVVLAKLPVKVLPVMHRVSAVLADSHRALTATMP